MIQTENPFIRLGYVEKEVQHQARLLDQLYSHSDEEWLNSRYPTPNVTKILDEIESIRRWVLQLLREYNRSSKGPPLTAPEHDWQEVNKLVATDQIYKAAELNLQQANAVCDHLLSWFKKRAEKWPSLVEKQLEKKASSNQQPIWSVRPPIQPPSLTMIKTELALAHSNAQKGHFYLAVRQYQRIDTVYRRTHGSHKK